MRHFVLVFTFIVLQLNSCFALQAEEINSHWKQVYQVGDIIYSVDIKHIYHRSWSEWTSGFIREKSPKGSKIYLITYFYGEGGNDAEIWTEHLFNGNEMTLEGAIPHDFTKNKGITKGQKDWLDRHLSKIRGFKLTVLTFFEDFLQNNTDEVIFLDKGTKIRPPNYPYIGANISD